MQSVEAQLANISVGTTEPEDFAAWVGPYLPVLARLAVRLAGPDRSDDVVQETLFRAWTKRGTYDATRGEVGAWLFAIGADQARKRLRRDRIRLFGRPVTSPSYEHEIDLDLQAALDRISPRQRLAIDCYYYVGLSVSETAAVMRCSEGTVKSTLSDARQRLRTLLEAA
jgi:RNA polymerase sigma factor (sigma-70 family)